MWCNNISLPLCRLTTYLIDVVHSFRVLKPLSWALSVYLIPIYQSILSVSQSWLIINLLFLTTESLKLFKTWFFQLIIKTLSRSQYKACTISFLHWISTWSLISLLSQFRFNEFLLRRIHWCSTLSVTRLLIAGIKI